MSKYIATRIKKARVYRSRKNVEVKQKFVVGFDSEADTSSDGRPMMFQFSLPTTIEQDTLLVVIPPDKQHAGLRAFLDFLDTYCVSKNVEYLVYGWNIQYELTQIFHDMPKDVRGESEFSIEDIVTKDGKRYDWSIEVLNNKRQIVTFTKGAIKVGLYDGTAFYKTSLDSAAKMLGLGEKYSSEGLDRSLFTRSDLDNEEFLKYARRDAYITRRIGEYIQQQHESYKIATCISAPHFAATIFRDHFLKTGLASITLDVEQAGLYSYHGGKNGFYLDGPTEFGSIWQYDITSAYPEAMRNLPNIETSGWMKLDKYVPDIHAMYCITVDYNRCVYRGIQNHDGSWAQDGIVDQVWITSYELDVLMEHGELGGFLGIAGYQMIGDSGGALQTYVDKFFHVKKSSKGPERETAKLLLNSLYGKFFQKEAIGSVGNYNIDLQRWIESDPDGDYDYKAGGLYNPPIASLITGFVRAKIHRLEHKYDAVMTSTDGFFANNPPDKHDLGSNIGDLTTVKGRLRLWRERLYVFDGDDGKRKFALHGFHGKVQELEDIPLSRGEYTYYGKQMITLKLSTMRNRGKQYSPGEFVRLPYVLRI